MPDTEKCLICHGGGYGTLAAKTAVLDAVNPHSSHLGHLECTECHHVHSPFRLYCNDCHTYPIPEKYSAGA